MNQTAQDKLRALRQRLAGLDPYPWELVETWIASAKPLIKAHYREHFEDFLTVATTPHWYAAIRVVPGPYSSVDPRRGRFAETAADETSASEHRENQRIARAAKEKLLAFVDGLLDIPVPPARAQQVEHSESEGPSPDQIKVLNLIAAHQLAHEAEISGKRLRVALDDFGLVHSLIGPLIDMFIRPTERIPPNDRYKLTLWGWVFSEHAPRVAALLDAVLVLLQKKFKKDPDFTHYSLAELREHLPSLDEDQNYFIRELLDVAQLCHGGDSSGWRIPWDIEVFRKLKGPSEFLQYRARQEAESRASAARAQRRHDMGFDPFDESADEVIDALGEGGSFLDLLSAFSFDDDGKSISIHHHYHGETHMGDKYDVTTTNSTIGAQAIGKNAHAVGTVNMSTPGTLTQEQHKAAITQAQNALNEDQDELERLDDRLYQALGQFLRMARQIQVEQQSLAQVQAQMKETLDDVWAQQVAKGLRPQALPEGLKVIEALAKSPITVEVAKKLLAGG